MNTPPTRRAYFKLSYRSHRFIGTCIALPVLLIAITGILLNHSATLHLESTFIRSELVLSWYGITPLRSPQGMALGSRWFTAVDDLLYCDTHRLGQITGLFVGVAEFDHGYAVATSDSLIAIDSQCEMVVEKLGGESLPSGPIEAIGEDGGRLLIDTASGTHSSSTDLARFVSDSRPMLPRRQLSSPPAQILKQILQDWEARGLSVWRILLDLHSGAFFGKFGAVIGDIAALALILLVVSGWYNSQRRRPVR